MKNLGLYAKEMQAISDLAGVLNYYLLIRRGAPDMDSTRFANWFIDLVVTILNHETLPPIWSAVFLKAHADPA